TRCRQFAVGSRHQVIPKAREKRRPQRRSEFMILIQEKLSRTCRPALGWRSAAAKQAGATRVRRCSRVAEVWVSPLRGRRLDDLDDGSALAPREMTLVGWLKRYSPSLPFNRNLRRVAGDCWRCEQRGLSVTSSSLSQARVRRALSGFPGTLTATLRCS